MNRENPRCSEQVIVTVNGKGTAAPKNNLLYYEDAPSRRTELGYNKPSLWE